MKILGLLRFLVVFILVSLVTIPFLLIQWLLRFLRARKLNRAFAYRTLSWISRALMWGNGARVTVSGLENLPKNRGVLFMSNHQEYSDILLCYGYLRTPMAMIAKKELGDIPFLATYMRSLECYMLDRKDPKQAMKLFQKAKQRLTEEHYSALIYPEGTRSRGPKNRDFMVGASRIAYLADTAIVPVTISGSWKAGQYITQVGGKKPIDIVIHPMIETKDYPSDQKQALMTKVQTTVESGFTSANDASISKQ
ncbi:lysophospholipid acyltransferase family protein [Entomospira culicis]|uniref:1-acyl-sn-glycerol-3-phosphate acyltransferase n=1 Tax=Entomospira culicis TaxID=2719989 RepID=A0A968GJ66_9SPIO|nr:lysophospholipid acyltransferase family protein [Entomospira culicis]NIZ19808.1 1-acyl-sn-glycerol-3-phosphate acyltransferase [Entomospira culicis]NIZ70022.1 1-acyl-sn-glycerol-3-phosphate acyltransferase [Entomospira culicis]WDI37128.1 lysophospholipid acyltransferase family protein [Entomospira culicis]WDI38757.1 lysophospholipid acyltransferase family protein [Entomospira culicis]